MLSADQPENCKRLLGRDGGEAGDAGLFGRVPARLKHLQIGKAGHLGRKELAVHLRTGHAPCRGRHVAGVDFPGDAPLTLDRRPTA